MKVIFFLGLVAMTTLTNAQDYMSDPNDKIQLTLNNNHFLPLIQAEFSKKGFVTVLGNDQKQEGIYLNMIIKNENRQCLASASLVKYLRFGSASVSSSRSVSTNSNDIAKCEKITKKVLKKIIKGLKDINEM